MHIRNSGSLQEYIPEDKVVEVKRVLYGANRGGPVQAISLSQEAKDGATEAGFDLQAYRFRARQEQNRKPRHVKIGLIQNSIKAPTTAPYAEQTQVLQSPAPTLLQLMAILQKHTSNLELGSEGLGSAGRKPHPAFQ